MIDIQHMQTNIGLDGHKNSGVCGTDAAHTAAFIVTTTATITTTTTNIGSRDINWLSSRGSQMEEHPTWSLVLQ